MGRKKKVGRKLVRKYKATKKKIENFGILTPKEVSIIKDFCRVTRSKFQRSWKFKGMPKYIYHYMISCKSSPIRNKNGHTLLNCMNRVSCKIKWIQPFCKFPAKNYIMHTKFAVTGTGKYYARVEYLFDLFARIERIMIKNECGVKTALEKLKIILEAERDYIIY
jgi:hypothetical protein